MLEELIGRYPVLESCRESIRQAYQALEECFLAGGKLLVAGNGGSAADSDHIVGVLMKGFVKKTSPAGFTGPGIKGGGAPTGSGAFSKASGRPSGHCADEPCGFVLCFCQ